MKRLLLSSAAEQDLAEIAEYIAGGRARDEIDRGVRSFPIGAYVLFYYADEQSVGIARILHARRDIATAFHIEA
jgi:toxin ParE1/3/4